SGQILGITLRRAGLHPVADQLLFLTRQTPVVDKVPEFGARVPGRHTVFRHDFRDRFGPARHFVVVRQCERRDLSLAMALDAMAVEYWRDVFGIADLRIRLGSAHAADAAAHRLGARLADGLIAQQFLDRLRQILAGRFAALAANRVLIVDASVVADL